MDIYSIFTLIGGLAFFLYGISVMSQGLEKTAGNKLENLLRKMTSNPLKSFALGAGITAIIQSSSAVTVMLIGLVNSGIMSLSQTVSVVIGANVGTTITSWMLSLTAIQDTAGTFFKLMKPETFAPILAFVGICLIMGSKKSKRKSLGTVFIGFAILMFGMEVMAGAMSPLSDMPEFRNIMVAFTNPVLGFIVGCVITMIIQSSSASIGILQALSLSGGVSWGVAIPIILGQNLGTCISAMLASIGVNTNAKRVAGIHVIYNILSVGICFPLFIILQMIFNFAFIKTDINPFGIAVFHTIYNIFTAFMLFPCAKLIEKLAIKYIPENKSDAEKQVLLDERLLLSPTLAISECFNKTIEMGELAQFNFINASKMLKTYRARMADEINDNEVKIDSYEYHLDSFLIKLSNRELTQEDGNKISQLVLAVSEFERIGDHASNILKVAEKFHDSGRKLSDEAITELKTIVNAVREVVEMALEVYKNDNLALAMEIEPLDAVIKKGVRRAKNNHIQRLKDGLCSVDTGFMYSDMLTDLRRISAHCSNIATSVVQLYDSTFDKHEYSHRNKDEDLEFKAKYQDYKSRFKVSKNYGDSVK